MLKDVVTASSGLKTTMFLVIPAVFNGLLYAITSTSFNEHNVHLIQDDCHFCDPVLRLMGFIGKSQTDAVIILKLVRIEGPHVVCIKSIVMWTKGRRTECPYEYNQHVTVRKVSFVSSYAPSYVICPKSKCTDFPMYELAT